MRTPDPFIIPAEAEDLDGEEEIFVSSVEEDRLIVYRSGMSQPADEELTLNSGSVTLFAENSVKHGLSGLKKGGRLEIRIYGEDDVLTIEIMDNGIGRARAAEESRTSTGKGLKLMNELFDLYRKYYDDKISTQITDLNDSDNKPCRTLVRISIQYRNDNVLTD